MKLTVFLLIAFIFIISVPHPDAVLATDSVKIYGYMRDIEGKPIEGVTVEAFSLTPPWECYGRVSTDAGGYYAFSLGRPMRLDVPVFYNGRPIHEGYEIDVYYSGGWMPTYCPVDTEDNDAIQQDFILKPAGTVKLNAYDPSGTLIEKFPTTPETSLENPTYPVYATDLYWRVIPSCLMFDQAELMLCLNAPNVINFPWNVTGFGKVILRADNDGNGFTLTRRGETIAINLNFELARTEHRLLRESYERYLDEGYVFSQDLSVKVQSAGELLQSANLATDGAERAHLADLCLNQTLWTAEDLELQKARQDIEKYRKGNVTLRIIDENGRPLSGVDVTVNQTTHDFLFGTLRLLVPKEVLGELGMNYGLLALQWTNTEPSLGNCCWEILPSRSDLKILREEGFRLGGESLINLEPPETWPTGLISLSFEELKNKIREHVYEIVSMYADYVDYWTVVMNPYSGGNYIGLDQDQVLELYRIGVEVVRTVDPTAKVLIFVDKPCGWTVGRVPYDDYSVDPYTYLSRLDEYGIDHDGISLGLDYNSADEFPIGSRVDPNPILRENTEILLYPFRDLASISRLLDWYGTLNEEIHITQFPPPANFTSNLGYWHRRSWDEKLQSEWVEKFYTIAFSKPLMAEITDANSFEQDFETMKKGLVSSNGSFTELAYTLKRLIEEDWTTNLRMKTDVNGEVTFRGFAGNYSVIVSSEHLEKNLTIHVKEGTNNTYQIKFDRNEIRSEMQTNVQGLLKELDKIQKWLKTVNEAKLNRVLEDIDNLTRLYDEGQLDQAIDFGKTCVENPLEMKLDGRLSDFEGFNPVLTDAKNDVAPGSPPGTDLAMAYAFADSNNLYLGIRVHGDKPNLNATFTVEIRIGSDVFHVFLRRQGTEYDCRCAQQPWKEGNIQFECSYAVDEIVEIRVPLSKLGMPEAINMTNLWIWQESTQEDYDSHDAHAREIPSLRSFISETELEADRSTATLLSYAAITAVLATIGAVAYWQKNRRRRPKSLQEPAQIEHSAKQIIAVDKVSKP